ncbi:DUF3107 domain-containing protein [Agromyces sp. Marseille-Q5079]|uniref:DUF3107 domain-containing protein n=1 Tax=Agromyces sp. Marseille-Q5079 TaxID=3439059 RepID=UPI003D9CB223
MDVRIGIQNSPRELAFESAQTPEEVKSQVAAALAGDAKSLEFVDTKGTVFLVPAAALAYVEISGEEARRVGFVA